MVRQSSRRLVFALVALGLGGVGCSKCVEEKPAPSSDPPPVNPKPLSERYGKNTQPGALLGDAGPKTTTAVPDPQ